MAPDPTPSMGRDPCVQRQRDSFLTQKGRSRPPGEIWLEHRDCGRLGGRKGVECPPPCATIGLNTGLADGGGAGMGSDTRPWRPRRSGYSRRERIAWS
jgi:hypothetical protein